MLNLRISLFRHHPFLLPFSFRDTETQRLSPQFSLLTLLLSSKLERNRIHTVPFISCMSSSAKHEQDDFFVFTQLGVENPSP